MEILESVIVWILTILGLLTLLAVAAVAVAVFSYSRIEITFKSVSASPDFNLKPASVMGSIFNAIMGNLVGAAGGFVNGVKLDGQITCRNRSIVPLYLPNIEHEVTVGGKLCQNVVKTPARWLAPLKDEAIPINFILDKGEIPHVAIAGLTSRGAIDIRIKSRVAVGPFAYVKTTDTKTRIPDYLPKRTKDPKGKNKPTK
jgi:hypothetical protein